MEALPQDRPLDGVYNETNWSNPIGNHIKGYSKSKTLAEQAAWSFQRNLTEDQKFEIVTINPGLIVGPTFVDNGFSSGELIGKIMNNEYPGMPMIMMPVVDVRECAHAHLLAVTNPKAANERFICVNKSMWFREIATALNTEFEVQGQKITTKELDLGSCSLTIAGWFIPEMKTAKMYWGKTQLLDNTKSREVLDLKYCDINRSLVDMAYSMFEQG